MGETRVELATRPRPENRGTSSGLGCTSHGIGTGATTPSIPSRRYGNTGN